jgi:hypothetical protein
VHYDLLPLFFIKLPKVKGPKNEFLKIQEDKIDALRASENILAPARWSCHSPASCQ